MTNLIRISTIQLVFFYFHVGFSKYKTHMLLYKYILGIYNNLSIINLAYTIFFLKSNFTILLMTLLNNGKVMFFSEDITFFKNKNRLLLKFFNVYFCLKRWRPGLFMFFRKFRKPPSTKFLYLESIPDFIIVLSYKYYHMIQNLYREVRKLIIPSLNLVDTIHNPLMFDYFILINIKSVRSIFFYTKILENIIFKGVLYKKHFFLKTVLKLLKKA